MDKRKQKPEGYWLSLENLRREAGPYIEECGGLPNSGFFKRIDRKDIMCGIYRYGGYDKAAHDLGVTRVQTVVQQSNCNVPIGYWRDWDNFASELKPLIEEYGTVPPQAIIRKVNYSLEHAFKYHGGFVAVRERLGLPRLYDCNKTQPHGYWGNWENLKAALDPIIAEYGNVPSSLTIEAKYGHGISAAIERHHGGFLAVRRKLGLPERFYSKENTRVSIYREIGLEAHGACCEICGYSDDVDVHHLDSNRLNNDSENLAVLCPNHHRKAHRLGWQGRDDMLREKLA